MSLETSSENPDVWKRHESLHASRWYGLPSKTYPCCDSRSRRYGLIRGCSTHTDGADVETTVVTATRGLLEFLRPPGWISVSE